MSYVALLVIFGDIAGHSADWAKTHQYSRFYANKKTRLFSMLPLVPERLRLAARSAKIEAMHFATRKKAQNAADIPR